MFVPLFSTNKAVPYRPFYCLLPSVSPSPIVSFFSKAVSIPEQCDIVWSSTIRHLHQCLQRHPPIFQGKIHSGYDYEGPFAVLYPE